MCLCKLFSNDRCFKCILVGPSAVKIKRKLIFQDILTLAGSSKMKIHGTVHCFLVAFVMLLVYQYVCRQLFKNCSFGA